MFYKTLKAELSVFASFLNSQFSRHLSDNKTRCGNVN